MNWPAQPVTEVTNREALQNAMDADPDGQVITGPEEKTLVHDDDSVDINIPSKEDLVQVVDMGDAQMLEPVGRSQGGDTMLAIERQSKYLEANPDEIGVVANRAFARSIRELGYKGTPDALNELVDNSYEAGATFCHIIFGFPGKSRFKPNAIAVADDGHGMVPEMIRRALVWGGTDREGGLRDEQTGRIIGFGKYGFGAPSSCTSIGTKFTFYSKVTDGPWMSSYVDLAEIEDQGRDYQVPPAAPATLPDWVLYQFDANLYPSPSGTVVVIEKIDRLTKVTTPKLAEVLAQKIGVTYHAVRLAFEIYIDGAVVEPIDPCY